MRPIFSLVVCYSLFLAIGADRISAQSTAKSRSEKTFLINEPPKPLGGRFIRINIDKDKSIDLPRSWFLIEGDKKILLEDAMASALDGTPYQMVASDGKVQLLAGTLIDGQPVNLTVYVVPQLGVRRNSIDGWSPQAIAGGDAIRKKATKALLERADQELLEWLGSEKVSIGQQTSAVKSEYLRTGEVGPKHVISYLILGDDENISLTFSYPVELKEMFASIEAKILRSLSF